MSHGKTVYSYYQHTDKKLCSFANQKQWNHFIFSQSISQRKHVDVEQTEEVKKTQEWQETTENTCLV